MASQVEMSDTRFILEIANRSFEQAAEANEPAYTKNPSDARVFFRHVIVTAPKNRTERIIGIWLTTIHPIKQVISIQKVKNHMQALLPP